MPKEKKSPVEELKENSSVLYNIINDIGYQKYHVFPSGICGYSSHKVVLLCDAQAIIEDLEAKMKDMKERHTIELKSMYEDNLCFANRIKRLTEENEKLKEGK